MIFIIVVNDVVSGNSQSKFLKDNEAEFWCMCYLELKPGSVSLTSIRGQQEVAIRLLKTKHVSQASGNNSRFVLLSIQCVCPDKIRQLTSESHSLKLTTAEFLSTSSRSIGTSLCGGVSPFSLSTMEFCIYGHTFHCHPSWFISRPGAADCQWQSAPRAWGCSWHRPGRGWTCHWCWRRVQQRQLCWTGKSAGTARGPAGLWPVAAPALPWKGTIWLTADQIWFDITLNHHIVGQIHWKHKNMTLLPECFHFWLGLLTHLDLISRAGFSLLGLSGQTSHPS